jgi:hypothetical protein
MLLQAHKLQALANPEGTVAADEAESDAPLLWAADVIEGVCEWLLRDDPSMKKDEVKTLQARMTAFQKEGVFNGEYLETMHRHEAAKKTLRDLMRGSKSQGGPQHCIEQRSVEEEYRHRLRFLFEQFGHRGDNNDVKIDDLLKANRGQEHAVYEDYCRRYGVAAQPAYIVPSGKCPDERVLAIDDVELQTIGQYALTALFGLEVNHVRAQACELKRILKRNLKHPKREIQLAAMQLDAVFYEKSRREKRARKAEKARTKLTAFGVYKERCYNLLMKFNKQAALEVEELLTKHKGNEHDLYLRMCRKYAVKAEDEFVPESDTEPSNSESEKSSSSEAPAPETIIEKEAPAEKDKKAIAKRRSTAKRRSSASGM